MGISVNDYSSDSLKNKVYSKYTTNSIDTDVSKDESSNYMDFDSYLKLLTAQMSNQDFNNSMSDSEFIQQMASYSMMEAISQLTKQNALTYSSSLIGKAVTVSNGTSSETGLVESVTVTDDGCKLLVNGNLYSADNVTDVVDGEVYSMLRTFKGQTVEIKDGDNVITGKVTGILIKNGSGYVTVDNKATYSMDAISRIVSDENEEGTEGTEGAENSGSTGDEGDQTTGTAQVEANESSVSYPKEISGVVFSDSIASRASGVQNRSAAVYDTLMKMLDDSNSEETAAVASIEEMYAASSVMSNLERLNYQTASVDESNAQSALASGRIPSPIGGSQTSSLQNSSSDNSYLFDDEETADDNNSVIQSPFASNGYDTGEEQGVTGVNVSNAASTSLNQYAAQNSTAAYTSASSSSRKYADKYPVEAAFADSVGTEMYDIRFIGNTSVNSTINTDVVIGYTQRLGHPITDLGWCGYGKLGEVVTFADGTQRVEVLYGDRVSHLFTSGRYTIDQICSGKIKDLTPQENVIFYHSREYTAEEQASLDAFALQCAQHAFYNQIASSGN